MNSSAYSNASWKYSVSRLPKIGKELTRIDFIADTILALNGKQFSFKSLCPLNRITFTLSDSYRAECSFFHVHQPPTHIRVYSVEWIWPETNFTPRFSPACEIVAGYFGVFLFPITMCKHSVFATLYIDWSLKIRFLFICQWSITILFHSFALILANANTFFSLAVELKQQQKWELAAHKKRHRTNSPVFWFQKYICMCAAS